MAAWNVDTCVQYKKNIYLLGNSNNLSTKIYFSSEVVSELFPKVFRFDDVSWENTTRLE